MKVYFISGLAGDYRMFRSIRLPAPYEIIHLHWIEPYAGESLADYALRMSVSIDAEKPFGLVGLSMGGMITAEIAKHRQPVFRVLLSSIRSARELPWYFRMAGHLRLQHLVPVAIVKKVSYHKRMFTRETPADKALLRDMIRSCDDRFIVWSMNAVLNWKESAFPSPQLHIHGAADAVLPARLTTPTHLLPRAGHLMVLTNAAEINKILERELPRIDRLTA